MFEVVPPRLKIDDLIKFFGYENNARGYAFIFDMINLYGLPVYMPIPTQYLHEGDYEPITALTEKFDLVLCQVKSGFFNERNFVRSSAAKRVCHDYLFVSEVLVSGNVVKCFKKDGQDGYRDGIPLNYEHCYAKGLEVIQFKKERLEKQNDLYRSDATTTKSIGFWEFPNPPQRRDDLYRALEEFFGKYHRSSEKILKSSEAWAVVKRKIDCKEFEGHDIGFCIKKQVITFSTKSGERVCDKESFEKRWARYMTPKK